MMVSSSKYPVASGHVPPPGDDAFVCETVPGSDTVSATSKINKKLEQEVDEILNLATPGLENTEKKGKIANFDSWLQRCVLTAFGPVGNRSRSRAPHRHRRCETVQSRALQNCSAQTRTSFPSLRRNSRHAGERSDRTE